MTKLHRNVIPAVVSFIGLNVQIMLVSFNA